MQCRVMLQRPLKLIFCSSFSRSCSVANNLVPSRVQLQLQLKACKTVEQLNPVLARLLVTGHIHHSLSLCKLVEFLVFSKNTTFLLYAHHLVELRHLSGLEDQAFSSTTTFLHNTLIRGYSRSQFPRQGLLVYSHLLHTSSKPDEFTFPFLLKAVSASQVELDTVREGKQVHAQIATNGFESDVFVVNTLMNMYSAFQDMDSAQNLFDLTQNLDIVSWNTLIDGYAKSGAVHLARRFFDQMPELNDISWTVMISGYVKHGELDAAQSLFDRMPICRNTATWNSLISGFSKSGFLSLAQKLFDEMPSRNIISWNSMIFAYAQRGQLKLARFMFDEMPERDVFSWSCMISGYAQNNQGGDALKLFKKMLVQGNVRPNEVTLMNVLAVCAHLTALDQGSWIHAYIQRNGMRLSDNLGAALIDMYAKCGCIDTAVEVFHKLDHKNVSSWNALITGLAINGFANGALKAFIEMQKLKTRPNNITFLGLLMACCHRGLVEEGRQHFESMLISYGIQPEMKHYGCMIDLLGRAGLLEEAEKVIRNMPMDPDVTVLGALLGACKIHGNVQVADRVWKDFLEPKSHEAGCHVLLSNIYAGAGRWTDASYARNILKENQIIKEPGLSSVELLQTYKQTNKSI